MKDRYVKALLWTHKYTGNGEALYGVITFLYVIRWTMFPVSFPPHPHLHTHRKQTELVEEAKRYSLHVVSIFFACCCLRPSVVVILTLLRWTVGGNSSAPVMSQRSISRMVWGYW